MAFAGINVMILVRVIKELTTIQQVKDSQTEQIRWDDKNCFSPNWGP